MASQDESPARGNHHISDHLANERTFLAWIRTSIAIIGMGFVVARFSVWLRELGTHVDDTSFPARHSGLSLPMGIGMMGVGGLLAVLASARYRRVRHAIEHDQAAASRHAVTVVTLLTLAIAASLAAYMLTAR